MGNLIAIDWRLSSFRAYILGDKGSVLQRLPTGTGILAMEEGGFEQCLGQ